MSLGHRSIDFAGFFEILVEGTLAEHGVLILLFMDHYDLDTLLFEKVAKDEQTINIDEDDS